MAAGELIARTCRKFAPDVQAENRDLGSPTSSGPARWVGLEDRKHSTQAMECLVRIICQISRCRPNHARLLRLGGMTVL